MGGCKLILRTQHIALLEETKMKMPSFHSEYRKCDHSICKLATFVNNHTSTNKDDIVDEFYLLQSEGISRQEIYYDLAALTQNALLGLEIKLCVDSNLPKLSRIADLLKAQNNNS